MTTPTLTPAGDATPGPSSRPAPQVGTAEVLARAEALYEQSRKRVSGRPPWAKLNPADPYDMGMRETAIRQAALALAQGAAPAGGEGSE